MAGLDCCPVIDLAKCGWQILIWLGTFFCNTRFSRPLLVCLAIIVPQELSKVKTGLCWLSKDVH